MDPRLAPVVALAVLAAACDAPLSDEAGAERGDMADAAEARAAIVGGEIEPGRPAVVAIVAEENPAELVCSGVLITPTIVVTAAHCLHPQVIGRTADELLVVFGASLDEVETRIDVLAGAYHPSWRLDDPEGANDIGAVRLAVPAPVDPIPLGPSPAAGESVVLVGFGDTGRTATTSGVKRSGEAVVAEIGTSWFRMDRASEETSATTCSGDSGGATLADVGGAEVLLGVHSRGDCATAVWNERVDVHAGEFLKAFMGEFGGCGQDGACALGCPDPDPDCPCASDGTCNAACGDADPDCTEEDLEADEACTGADADCQSAEPPPPRGGWGSAGCGVAPAGDAGGGALAAVAAAVLAAAARASRRRRP